MNQELALLEQMKHTADAMVVAAEAGDWEHLAKLERGLATTRTTLVHLRIESALTDDELMRKRALVESTLSSFDTVRTCVLPWMESTRKLLSGNAKDRAVKATYGPHTR